MTFEKEPVNFQLETELVDVLDHICGSLDIKRSAGLRKAVKEWCAREMSKGPAFWIRAAYGVRNRTQDKSPV
jgi:hypothetical protein